MTSGCSPSARLAAIARLGPVLERHWLEQRWQAGWLVGDRAACQRQLRDYQRQLHGRPQRILLLERQPEPWLAGFLAAMLAGWPLFLGNPNWGTREAQQAIAGCQPELIWGEIPAHWGAIARPAPTAEPTPEPIVAIPTGGSSGQVRFATHTWATLAAAARGFQAHFGGEPVNALNVLPLYHVSGLLPVLRSLLSGGLLELATYATLKAGSRPQLAPESSFLSLVPTQLQALLAIAPDWLARWRALLVGGGPTWPSLQAAARQADLPLALTYGATETAAQVATLQPSEFRAGRADCGRALPHVELQILGSAGEVLPAGAVGAIAVRAPSLFQGYYPERHAPEAWWPSGDWGVLDADGHLTVLGRQSQTIITGGEKVFPGEVEAAIRATGAVADVAVVGIPDERWGQAVVALCARGERAASLPELAAAIRPLLADFKQPKHWCWVPSLPRNAQGKLQATALQAIARRALQS